MDFFNKVGSTISSKSKDVTKKAKELAEIAKLTGQIAEKEESVKGAYIFAAHYDSHAFLQEIFGFFQAFRHLLGKQLQLIIQEAL